MDTLIPLAVFLLFAIGVAVVYYRFRDNFSDLAAATDSKRSNALWTVVALIFAVVIAVLYSMVYGHGF